MSYTPTVWATGDVVTAEKLNKLEQGVASAGGGSGGGGNVLLVNCDLQTMTLDKTWQEIQTAMATSVVVIYQAAPDYGFWAHLYVTQVRSDEYGNYIIEVNNGDQFRATSASGYPVYYNPI